MAGTGIMGGTFNPIHVGHLIAAQEAMDVFGFEKILFIPNRKPPHRQNDKTIAEGEDRYLMVNEAIAENPNFFASRIELDRPGLSYTLDTVKALKKEMPGEELSFITGVDSILKDSWYGMDELLGLLTYFIAANRPGFDENRLSSRIEELGLTNGEKIKPLRIPGVHISSTLLRQRIKEGRTIKYLVPSNVEIYISKKRLYR